MVISEAQHYFSDEDPEPEISKSIKIGANNHNKVQGENEDSM